MARVVVRAYNGGLGKTIHFISQFSPNFGVILVVVEVRPTCPSWQFLS